MPKTWQNPAPGSREDFPACERSDARWGGQGRLPKLALPGELLNEKIIASLSSLCK